MGPREIYWFPVSFVPVLVHTRVSSKHISFLVLVSHVNTEHPHCPVNLTSVLSTEFKCFLLTSELLSALVNLSL